MAWLTDYNYRVKVPVNSTVSGAQTNYQMKLSIYKSTGTNIAGAIYLNNNSLSWPNDIMFTDANGNSIDFWRETSDTNGGTWWIEIPNIPSTGSVDIYVHYGNAIATDASNGRNTFIAFDDFATGSSEQWTMAGVTSDRTTNHRLDVNGATGSTWAYLDKTADIGDFEFLYKYRRTSGAASGFGVGIGDTITNDFDAQNDGVAALDHLGSGNQQFKHLRVYDQAVNYGTNITAGASNTTYWGKLTRLNNVYETRVYSDALLTTEVWNNTVTRSGLTNLRYIYAIATITDLSHTATGWMTDIRIRKYVSTEPTWETPLSQELNTSWNYRKEITVSNSGSLLAYYQVSITVDTAIPIAAGKMLSNCQDIRFVDSDNSTVLQYWIESGVNTSSTKIWIKIPSIPNGSKTIYMYYGNSAETYDNSLGGNNTFELFDDFNTGSIDTLKWTIYGSPTVSASNLNINSAESIVSIRDLSSTNIEVATRMKVNSATYGSVRETHAGIDINANWFTTIGFIGYAYGGIYGSYIRDAASETYGMWTSFTLGTYHRVSGRYDATTTYGTIDGASYSHAKVVSGSNKKIAIKEDNWAGGSSSADFDWIFVRRYASPEPTFSVSGTEQTPPNITATAMTITPTETPCRVGLCTVNVSVTWTNNGGSEDSFVPNITIDGSPIAPIYLSQSLAKDSSVTKEFTITGLTTGTHTICPTPN